MSDNVALVKVIAACVMKSSEYVVFSASILQLFMEIDYCNADVHIE